MNYNGMEIDDSYHSNNSLSNSNNLSMSSNHQQQRCNTNITIKRVSGVYYALTNNYDVLRPIGKGAYGCVYRPGVKCDGTLHSKEYLSKIQLRKARTANEPNIGKRLSISDQPLQICSLKKFSENPV